MSHALSLVRLFTRNPERIRKVMQFYIHHRNLLLKGGAELGFVRNLFVNVQGFMVTYLTLKSMFPWISNKVLYIGVPACIIARVMFSWILGAWWDKNALYDREADWQNARNPVLDGLDKKVLKGEE